MGLSPLVRLLARLVMKELSSDRVDVSKMKADSACPETSIPRLVNSVLLLLTREELLLLPVKEEFLALSSGTSKTDLEEELPRFSSTEMVLPPSLLLHLPLLSLLCFSETFQCNMYSILLKTL